MAKIMLVEDDNNLREIYEARLQAENYEVVSAQDGEEALVIAKKEHPDLIISDVMMPKISGFEMLDILRNTDGMKNVKVIMLTALGQADDKDRADNLGANRYLVKSQVTLEDIVKSASELLGGEAAPTAAPIPTPAANPAASTLPTNPPQPMPVTPQPQPNPVVAPVPAPTQITVNTPPIAPPQSSPPPAPPAPVATMPPSAITPPPTTPAITPSPTAAINDANDKVMESAINQLVASTNKEAQLPSGVQAVEVPPAPSPQNTSQPAPAVAPTAPELVPDQTSQAEDNSNDDAPVSRKIIKPLNDGAPKTDLTKLLAQEEAKEQAAQAAAPQLAPAAPVQNNPAGPNPNDIAL